MVSISKIFTLSITEQVADAIRKAIIEGEFEPGLSLSESMLSKKFNVSRTPIRESLKQLEREGLVTITPRVGTVVRKSTASELTELFTVKEALEGLAAGQLAKNQNRKVIEKLETNIIQMEQAIKDKNHHLYVEANKNFHNQIIEGANNTKLTMLLNLLLNQIPYHQYVHMTIDAPNRIEKSLEEHRDILNKIRCGDSAKAEKAMRKHVKASEIKLIEIINKKLK